MASYEERMDVVRSSEMAGYELRIATVLVSSELAMYELILSKLLRNV
jgi:hypothetical protein